ncbi:pleckstrin domain-containing protein [Heterostelium album PN500]|uniref:Pleckstrin domain-containing protein n=1 Tax=Heterostelium pallidum (strain ATCC 26659 / Pp 5 / PN500) TaxID=670386 RepID=D3B3G4_HETP5|nr:pleckstrin domain-containing protein [Heterostelium album PN500]EFA83862.1 pleckstrin domain-containing protein [Heterostelium album PN500]|eukprot:XP_020435979.1 pleckstrin domain-containing protein [Heterostelium album PN500]
MASIVFDQNLGGQVDQFLGDVDDLLTVKTGSPAEKLIRLLQCEERPVRENALAFLAFANQAPTNKDASREAGLIPIFIQFISPSTVATAASMAKHAVMSLMFLANHSDVNKEAIAAVGGVDNEKALSAVNNICMHKDNKDNARVAGTIEAVIKLFQSKKATLVDSAVRMIYNMTIVDANREALRRCGGLEALVGILNQQDAIKLIVLKALSNMAVDRQTIEYVIQNKDTVLKPILDLFPLNNNEPVFDQVLTVIQNLVSEDNLIEEVSKNGIVEKIIPSIKGMPLQNTSQQSILIKSSCIISALVTIEDVQQSAVENGIVDILIDLLKYPSVDIRKEAARSLANATPYYDDVRGEVGKLGGVELALDLLLSNDKEVAKQAARALVNLARNTHNEEKIYEAKGIEHSIRLINSAEKDLKMLGTKLLVNLSLNEKARISFCQKGGLSIVLQLLSSPDQELQLQGTKVVTNLAISGRNRKLMNENVPELVPTVKSLLNSSSAEIKAQADVAISNMSFPYEKSYDGLDFGLEEQFPTLLTQSQYEHEDDDDDEDKEEAQKARLIEEEELRLAAETEINERKRIMEEEMKRIELRRKQEEEKRKQEEEEKRKQKEEAERVRKLAEEMERLRLEEEEKQRKADEEKRRADAAAEAERLEKLSKEQAEQERAAAAAAAVELAAKLAKEEVERKKREEEERVRREEEERKRRADAEIAEQIRLAEEERRRKEQEEEEERRRKEEEEFLKRMEQEIKDREEEIKRKKEEEDARRRREEEAKRAQEAQDKASQEAAKAAQEAARANKRTHIVQEIMHVEANYVRNLGLIVKKFLNPLVSAAASKRPIITQDKIKAIFSIVEIIHNFNSMLSDSLQSRVKRWLADNKKDALIIGDIFIKTTDFMTVYSTYINNYNNAIKNYNECKKTNPAFAQFIKKVENDPEMNDQELENLLINPVQQLPRYVMLLADLIKNTNDDHPDHKALVEALEKIRAVTSYVNERKRDAEDAMTMVSIHQNLRGKIPSNFLAPHRKFVKEGNIQFGSSSGSFKDKDPAVFLFTDMLMMTAKHPNKPNEYKFRYSVMLTHSTVIEDFARINNGFIVKAAQWWMFSCATPTEKQQWIESLNKVIQALPKK